MNKGSQIFVQCDQNHMATTFSLKLRCEASESSHARLTLEKVHQTIARIERELSEFLPDSDVSRVNRAKSGEKIRVEKSVIECLELSLQVYLASNGSFNPTFRSSSLGRFTDQLRWDIKDQTVVKSFDQTHISFGALGKGYALDQVRVEIDRAGFSHYILNAGGSSQIISGFDAENQPWTLGWSWKKDENGLPQGFQLAHHTGETLAIGVSGFHEKGEHIQSTDPKWDVNSERPLSTMVVGSSAALADAASTALIVLSDLDQDQTKSLESLGSGLGLAILDQNETPRWNRRFQKVLGSTLMGLALFNVSHAEDGDSGEGSIDLDAMDGGSKEEAGAQPFLPYQVKREPVWVGITVFMIFMILIHLKKVRKIK